jgi:hypothetical protein
MTNIRGLIAVSVCLLLFSPGISPNLDAQGTDFPLFFVYDRGLYAYEPGDTQAQRLIGAIDETGLGAVESPRLSPDFAYIAYRTPALITIASGGAGGGQNPDNLMLYVLDSGEVSALAVQPEGASFNANNVPDRWRAHSAPAWSPDGRQIAWSELNPDGQIRLLVRDIASGTVSVITDSLPPQFGVPTALPVYWGQSGIFISNAPVDPDTFSGLPAGYLLFDLSSTLLADVTLEDEQMVLRELILVLHEGREYLAGFRRDNDMPLLIDPLTGESQTVSAYLEMYSLHNPDLNGVLFEPTRTSSGRRSFKAIYYDPSMQTVIDRPLVRDWSTVALSPGGLIMAYQPYDPEQQFAGARITTVNSGLHFMVPLPGPDLRSTDLFWGPVGFRTNLDYKAILAFPDFVRPTPTTFVCPGTLPPQLDIGGEGMVLPGDPNTVRIQPGTGFEVLGRIPAGDTFRVIAGPVCADGYVWWQVEYNDLIGWTAEGDTASYWLAPVP